MSNIIESIRRAAKRRHLGSNKAQLRRRKAKDKAFKAEQRRRRAELRKLAGHNTIPSQPRTERRARGA